MADSAWRRNEIANQSNLTIKRRVERLRIRGGRGVGTGKDLLGKQESYGRELEPLIQRYLHKGKERRVNEYLTAKSNLPGPRANLELLGAFGDAISKGCREKPASYWELAMMLARSRGEVEGKEQDEFVVMCGVVALASIEAALPRYFSMALAQLKEYSHSSGWRTRESVAMVFSAS